MRVLLTRPHEDSERTATALRARGYEAILSPLMEIKFLDGPERSLNGVQAILATSANGIRALAKRTERRDLSIFAVGPQTTLAARKAGFSDVRDADGDANALAETVSRWLNPKEGALVHATGNDHKHELAEALTKLGFRVRTDTLYEAIATVALTPEAETALGNGTLDAVMLFSPRSAATFAEIMARTGLTAPCSRMIAICISAAAAAALQPVAFHEIRVAKRPNQDSMLDLLGSR